MPQYFILNLLLLVPAAACPAQGDSLKLPDKLSYTAVAGIYKKEKNDRKDFCYSFKQSKRFSQSGWPKKGKWEIINDTIYCHGRIPFYSINRYRLHTPVITWKMIIVNGNLYRIKKLLDGHEYRIEFPYVRIREN